jgi:hypothetical protein
MNNAYEPRPKDFIFPSLFFIMGTPCLMSDYWLPLGKVFYAIGIVLTIVITWASLWDVFIRKTQAMQYLFESARHLDRERLDALLHALGLKPIPVQQFKTDITINQADSNDAITTTRNIFNLPISIEQLHALADALINQGMNYSRREIVGRGIMTDEQHRKTQPIFERERIIELKNPANPNAGFKLSDYGVQVMREYAPSPTPHTEDVHNPA